MRKICMLQVLCSLVLALTIFMVDVSSLYALSFFRDEAFYEDAAKSFKNKDYDKSLFALKNALKIKPDYFEAKHLLGWNYIMTGRLAEAETIFLLLKKEKSEDVRPMQGLAWTYYGQGKNDHAEIFFKNEMAAARKHVENEAFSAFYPLDLQSFFKSIVSDAHHGLGLVAKQRKDYPTAVKHIEAALAGMNQFTQRTDLLMALGDVYYEQGQISAAIDTYKKAVGDDEKNHAAQLKLAWVYYYSKQYGNAEKVFEKAVGLKGDSVESVYGKAISQYMQSKYDSAYGNFAKAIALNPYYVDNPFVHEIIAKKPPWRTLWKDFGMSYKGRYAYNYRLGNYHAALYKLSGYIEKVNPKDFDAMVAMGWCYRWIGNLNKAIEVFNDAAKLNGKAAEPYVGLGSAYSATGKMGEALEAYNRALSLDPQSPTAYNGLAYFYYYTKKDPGKAEEYLRKATSLKKDYFDSQAFLANLLFEMKRYEDAAKEYDNLIKIDKSVVTAWNGLGWSFYYAGKFKKAAAAFRSSQELNPFMVEPYYGLGLTYAKMRDWSDAKDEMTAAIDIYPGYAHTKELVDIINAGQKWQDLYKVLGWSYLNKQQYVPASAAFNVYLAIRPDDDDALKGQAWSYYRIGRLDDAYTLFQKLLSNNENDKDALTGIGWTLYHKGQDAKALAYMEKAVRIDDNLTNAWRGIGAVYFRGKRYAEAKAVYSKIAALEPHALDASNNQGWALYKERNYEGAIRKFNESLLANRYMGEPYYGLALCYQKMGDIDRARESFIMAIYLYPLYMDGKELYEVLDSHPKLKDLNAALGWSYFYKYDYRGAQFHFNRILRADGSNSDALLGQGTVSYTLGDFKGAIEDFTRLLPSLAAGADVWDKNSSMLESLGWSYYNLKDYDKAMKVFKQLESYHPKVTFIAPINGKAWCELMKGNKAEAERLFTASLKILPGNYSADWGMRSLKK